MAEIGSLPGHGAVSTTSPSPALGVSPALGRPPVPGSPTVLGMPPVPPPPAYPPPPAHQPGPPPSAPGRTVRGTAAAGICLVLGAGLLGGAAAGHFLGGDPAAAQTSQDDTALTYADARSLWHSVPVDTLFPRTVHGRGAGPGGADRTWTRIGVAPDSGCDGAFDPALASALAPVGCLRLLRATYTDATSSNVTTVGVLVTRADPASMAALRGTWAARHLGDRTDAMPRPVPFPGTVAAGFGPAQRASWTVDISDTLPVIGYAVSGFADGRTVTDPQPAAAATRQGATTAAAQSGLGYDAKGLASAIEHHIRTAVERPAHTHGTAS
ncbi:hypothetical protein GCM10009753_42500 [Streptantibioticus ferralitis]|uniref:PknH-like extracellular domain-containing protein n=2 Tax=Streptantibioticus ferralitis TaxID=236510 RepID=A0ABT5Z6X4_9ACTN|nr:hypothetical protein [Streptantibioticus ferralitis]MDF2259583.1 hypothetical protein [Streptantibioticus ferralitis]